MMRPERTVLILSCALAGCATAPTIEALDAAAQRATGVERPFVIRLEAEHADNETDLDGVISPAQAVRLALQHDPRIQAAAAKLRAALAESRQARLLPNPVLDIVIRFPERGGRSMIDASLSADLISLLRRPGEITRADHLVRAQSAQALSAVLDVAADAHKAYVKVQASDALHALAESRRGLLALTRDLVRNRLEAGEGNRLDVLTVESELAALDIELTESASERRAARLALARLIGRPSMPPDFAVLPLTRTDAPELTESVWIEAALRHRPEVAAARWELAALGESAKLAGIAPFDDAAVGLHAERDRDWNVGPGGSSPIPIFDFGQARREQAFAQRNEARHKLTAVQRQVIQEVRLAIAAHQSAQASLAQVAGRLIPMVQQRREQSQNAYRAGLTDITSVRLAEQDLQAARAREVLLQQKAIETLVDLHRAVGGAAFAPMPPTTSPAALRPTLQPPRHGQPDSPGHKNYSYVLKNVRTSVPLREPLP